MAQPPCTRRCRASWSGTTATTRPWSSRSVRVWPAEAGPGPPTSSDTGTAPARSGRRGGLEEVRGPRPYLLKPRDRPDRCRGISRVRLPLGRHGRMTRRRTGRPGGTPTTSSRSRHLVAHRSAQRHGADAAGRQRRDLSRRTGRTCRTPCPRRSEDGSPPRRARRSVTPTPWSSAKKRYKRGMRGVSVTVVVGVGHARAIGPVGLPPRRWAQGRTAVGPLTRRWWRRRACTRY